MIIAHFSDFHLRPDKRTMCLNKIDQIKKCILSKNAQIIVYTGDIVDYRFIESDENKKKNLLNLRWRLLENFSPVII